MKFENPIFIDASVFLGMHCDQADLRIACKNFFVSHFRGEVYMNLEQVGKCDDIIWAYSRELQDDYYPFMDRLHSEMKIRRIAYQYKDLETALKAPGLKNSNSINNLLLAQVQNYRGILYTIHSVLENIKEEKERPFPKCLERAYQKSLMLKVPSDCFL